MNKEHIENSLNKIRSIFEKAAERIEAIPVGGKIPATKLASDLAEEVGMNGATLYPTLKFLIDDYPGFKILRGAHGGIARLAPVVDAPASIDPTPSVSE